MKPIVLKSFRPIASLCVAAVAILSTASASKAGVSFYYDFNSLPNNQPSSLSNEYAFSCFAPSASPNAVAQIPTGGSSFIIGPLYTCNGTPSLPPGVSAPPNSLPGVVRSSYLPGGVPTDSGYINAYNDTPYSIVSEQVISDQPGVTLDASKFQSNIWKTITAEPDGSVLFSNGAVAPYTWHLLYKQFTDTNTGLQPTPGTTIQFHFLVTFATVPEPSAALSLLVFGACGAGLLVKNQVERKRFKLSPAKK